MKKFRIWQTSDPTGDKDGDDEDGEGHPVKPIGPPPTNT